MDRVFSVGQVESLEINCEDNRARVGFSRGRSTPVLLRLLASAMRSERVERLPSSDLGLIAEVSGARHLKMWREGRRLTFLRVKRLGRERLLVSHPVFSDASLRGALVAELAGTAYLYDPASSGRFGGSVDVRFQSGRMTLESILEIIESVTFRTLALREQAGLQPIRFRKVLVNTNLALALVSDYLFAPARIASVFTLWLLNIRHVWPAYRSLRAGRFNLDVLYTTIAFLTLLSLSFTGSALMYWLLEFWPARVKQLRDTETAKFLARIRRCPRTAWIERGGAEMEVALADLRQGDTVILRQGDVVPGDGFVLSGEATVTEGWSGRRRSLKAGGDIHASGEIASGEVRIRIDSPGSGVITAQLAEWHGRSTSLRVKDPRVERFANSAVLPAIALGVVAILRGGVSMAKPVIRSDYLTGPSLSRELGWVTSVIQAAQHGVFIGNDDALRKLAECDCFVISSDIGWHEGDRSPGQVCEALRGVGVEVVLLHTGKSSSSVRGRNGDDRPSGNLDMRNASILIKERQYLGRQVAFFGDCIAQNDASSQADVGVHVCAPPFAKSPPSDIVLLDPSMDGIVALREIAAKYNNGLRATFGTVLLPNAACVVGALYFGLPIIGAIVLTNAGTFASYFQASRALRRAGDSKGLAQN